MLDCIAFSDMYKPRKSLMSDDEVDVRKWKLSHATFRVERT